MVSRSDFTDHVVEMMRLLGPVEAKRMFGGWGLYHRGVFFALVAEDTLYLKADDETRAEFEALGREPFVFRHTGGETIVTSYYLAPDEALESPAEMADWARKAYGAALRAAAKKKQRGSKPKPTAERKARPRR